jgi:hypothetical protein
MGHFEIGSNYQQNIEKTQEKNRVTRQDILEWTAM